MWTLILTDGILYFTGSSHYHDNKTLDSACIASGTLNRHGVEDLPKI